MSEPKYIIEIYKTNDPDQPVKNEISRVPGENMKVVMPDPDKFMEDLYISLRTYLGFPAIQKESLNHINGELPPK